jgi:carnitine O-acetyltransferase
MTEFMIGSLAGGKIARGDSSAIIPEPKQLLFELDDKAKKYIKTAEKNFEELIGSHDLEVCFN